MVTRRDPSAREAVEYAADAGLFPAPVIAMNPDCVAGKHAACSADGWNETDEMPADCPCPCHDAGGWGEREPQPTRHDRPARRPERHEPRIIL